VDVERSSLRNTGASFGSSHSDRKNFDDNPDVFEKYGQLMKQAFQIFTLVLLFMSRTAFAHCTYDSPAVPSNLSLPPTVSVSRDAPPGTTIYTSPAVTASVAGHTCDATSYNLIKYLTTLTPAGSSGVFQTNVPGIGIKVSINAHVFTSTSTWVLASSNPPGSNGGGSNSFFLSYVVTGPITAGIVTLPSPLAAVEESDSTTDLVGANLENQLNVSGSTTIILRSCTTPSIVPVDMGKHSISELPAVGATTSVTQFNITLNACPSGMGSVSYEIDPLTTIVAGTGNSVVTLDTTSSASGIGVQLVDSNGNPFELGKQVTFAGYDSSTGGTYTIPLGARYYRTGPVGPGSANTLMTFTMTYL
jgi:major type 1 subunit fimbrin (pilin)